MWSLVFLPVKDKNAFDGRDYQNMVFTTKGNHILTMMEFLEQGNRDSFPTIRVVVMERAVGTSRQYSRNDWVSP